jgi:CHAT domain-containing protein
LLNTYWPDPHSYALAITHNAVHRYTLPPKAELEQEATLYRSELIQQKADLALAQRLFDGLLGGIPEFKEKQALIVVPDGKLHLLPFSALANSGQYIVASHLVSVAPSGTVLDILRRRAGQTAREYLPYLGVAAWTSKTPPTTLIAAIRRAVSGPERQELIALPESRNEVETIATDLPKPSTILLGDHATESDFKRLPLNQYNVIHLALHGYADSEFPDRSALVFAPESPPVDGVKRISTPLDSLQSSTAGPMRTCNSLRQFSGASAGLRSPRISAKGFVLFGLGV